MPSLVSLQWAEVFPPRFRHPHRSAEVTHVTDLLDLKANPSRASDPLDVLCSNTKLLDVAQVPRLPRWTTPFLPWWREYCHDVSVHLTRNDSRAALVVSVEPLLVAAYSTDLDCVAMLEFPSFLVAQYGLEVSSRLVTCNGYWVDPEEPIDLRPGPGNTGDWTNFMPVIADFLTDEIDKVEARKAQISDEEW